jgi:hypothetical protein
MKEAWRSDPEFSWTTPLTNFGYVRLITKLWWHVAVGANETGEEE